MKCRVCGEDKLSKEFPRENIADACNHPPTHCFRCVIGNLKDKAVCPYKYNDNETCGVKVDNPQSVVECCSTHLEQLYPSIQPSHEVEQLQQLNIPSSDQRVNVVMLTGDSATIQFNPEMTIEMLKKEVEKKFNVPLDKQQLTYNESILEDYKNGMVQRLKHYNIQPFSTVHLMVLLYAIPQHFNHVIFDLFWGYPSRGRDYLDASCLAFSMKSNIGVVDYRHRRFAGGSAIHHSGDVMDDVRCIGHHTIEVRLKDIPSNITHLYFTLSAWNSPTISHYPNPSLKFYEASDKTKDLCSTTFTQARNSQAVIMCSVSRTGSQWRIFECGKLSAGNAKNYNPLVSTIQGLIGN